ncbi:MAG: NAD-dependent deacylase [Saprospiraceae bacterium]|nr:NAD-dependent deacylase [Candidatus Defluviibacterium haderslevense]
MPKKIIFFTGAGMSAESGIKTFRDADGLWEGHDVMKVASIQGWHADPELVLDFYNQRRRQLLESFPNKAHIDIANLQDRFNIQIITQNVDDLHERAGNKQVIHLHGELLKSRSVNNHFKTYTCKTDIRLGDRNESGHQLRPHIVWFGEEVPMMELAIQSAIDADICVIVGSSLQVYPAAGFVAYLPSIMPIYYIDPKPVLTAELARFKSLKIIPKKATDGLKELLTEPLFN